MDGKCTDILYIKDLSDGDIYINKVPVRRVQNIHRHDFIEIAYIYQGSGVHVIDGREYDVSKGDLFIINYDSPHGFYPSKNSPDGSMIVMNCVFTPYFLDLLDLKGEEVRDLAPLFLYKAIFKGEHEPDPDFCLLGNDDAEIMSLYESMYKEYQKKGKGYLEMLKAYLIQLLVKIFRLYDASKDDRGDDYSNRRQLVYDAVDFLQENYLKNIRVGKVANHVYLSTSHFCRLFRETMGCSVIDYIHQLRIEKACSLLKDTDRTVIQIANEVGYKDIKYFYGLFKRMTGKKPGDYR